jgi:hypothetical protein
MVGCIDLSLHIPRPDVMVYGSQNTDAIFADLLSSFGIMTLVNWPLPLLDKYDFCSC